jgi:hypothetical protein
MVASSIHWNGEGDDRPLRLPIKIVDSVRLPKDHALQVPLDRAVHYARSQHTAAKRVFSQITIEEQGG